MVRTCSRCDKTEPEVGFYAKSGYCKSCHVQYYRERARREPGYFNAFQKKRRARKRAFVAEQRVAAGCADCGERHPACLDLHHLDPSTKTDAVVRLVDRNRSFDVIAAEIAKCIVLCSNCHRKRHYAERTAQSA